MIIAGIDEAGYGPLLGPLVVGCSAFFVPEKMDAAASFDDLPCIWTLLGKFVSRTRSRSGKKIHINDSKAVYSPATGISELERSVLSIATVHEKMAMNLDEFIEQVAADCMAAMRDARWYEPSPGEKFPVTQDAISIKMFANALQQDMKRTGVQCRHIAARVLFEKPLNHLLDQTHNKSSVLFSTVAIHLDYLLRNYADQNLWIFCDRQGGRSHYGPSLRLMFEDWSLGIIQEIEGQSDYELSRNGLMVRVTFREKAEAKCLPVAMASMVCKYLRETLMGRFNHWWIKQIPGLKPTAGYHTDGMRFLSDIAIRRDQLKIPDAELIRSR